MAHMSEPTKISQVPAGAQDPNSHTLQAAFTNKQSQSCKDGAGCISAQQAPIRLLPSILHRALVTLLGDAVIRTTQI